MGVCLCMCDHVCMHMCEHVCVFMHACTCVCACLRVGVYMCVHCVHVCAQVSVCLCMCVHVCMHVYLHVCTTCVYACVSMRVCVCVCMCARVHACRSQSYLSSLITLSSLTESEHTDAAGQPASPGIPCFHLSSTGLQVHAGTSDILHEF